MGPLDKPENEALEDITWSKNWYEFTALIGFTVMMFVIGIYPAPFFELMDGSVSDLVRQFAETAQVAAR